MLIAWTPEYKVGRKIQQVEFFDSLEEAIDASIEIEQLCMFKTDEPELLPQIEALCTELGVSKPKLWSNGNGYYISNRSASGATVRKTT